MSTLAEAGLSEVVLYLRSITGIDIPAHRRGVLASALAELGSATDLRQRLENDPVALQKIIHAVTIPETYLFRHPGHFAALAELAADRRSRGLDCRVLCAGCATGEEVWSAAAVLASVYWPSRRYSVEGWDLDGLRTAKASCGEVREWGARAGFASYDRFFRKVPGGYAVLPELRPGVSFLEVNLAKDVWPTAGRYDAILFRNVAIYWEPQCIRRVVQRLVNSLAEDGLLLLGPCDPVDLDKSEFRWSMYNNVLAYRRHPQNRQPAAKPSFGAAHIPVAARRSIRVPGRRPFPMSLSSPVQTLTRPITQPIAQTKATDAPPDFRVVLGEAERLADAGFHEQALALLDGRVPPVGRVLAGIVLLHLDRAAEATEKFRQAVFLEPNVPGYRQWLALGLDALGHSTHAERERAVARELEP